VFASVAEYAGGPPDPFGNACEPDRGIGVALFQGDADFVVPAVYAMQARDGWVSRMSCNPTPASDPVSEGQLLRYTGCDDRVEVIWRTYPGQSHLWPTGARQQDILSRMWAHFEAHPLP
jgi:poly(3-hydroxybutyrate) depolymerase